MTSERRDVPPTSNQNKSSVSAAVGKLPAVVLGIWHAVE